MSEVNYPSDKKIEAFPVLSGNIRILYEDAHIIVCRKPSGIPVQSANMRVRDMVSILKLYLLEQSRPKRLQGEPYIGVVHRLDQPVQGIVVFAKTKKAAADLSAQMADGKALKQMKKRYCAVTLKNETAYANHGDIEGYTELVDYLLKDGRTNTSRIVSKNTKNARECRLRYRIVEERQSWCLVDIELLTGRHHQIRVQLAQAGMPIVGDQKYGAFKTESSAQCRKDILALCAYSLTFKHPQTGKQMVFSVRPQGGVFEKFADNFR